MKSNVGYKEIECNLTKTDPEVIEKIASRTGVDAVRIRKIMRYNMFTVKQFAVLTGLSVATILNKASDSAINGVIDSELDFCYPFGVEEKDGPKFIVRNEKAEKHLRQ